MIISCEKCDAANKIPQDGSNSTIYTCHHCGEKLSMNNRTSSTSSFPSKDIIALTEKTSWRDSLQAKMSLMLILITSTVFCGFVFYNHLAAKAQKRSELQEFAEITSQRLAKALSDPLWNIDKVRIDNILASEMKEKRISAIVIKDDDNQSAIFGKRRNEEWQATEVKNQTGDGFIENRKSILHGTKVIGALEIYFTTHFMNNELRQSIIDLVTNAVILNLAIVLTTIMFLRKMIIKPIRQLSETTLRMSKGDLTTRFDTKQKGEIGMLTQSVERVQTSMRMALDRIKKRS